MPSAVGRGEYSRRKRKRTVSHRGSPPSISGPLSNDKAAAFLAGKKRNHFPDYKTAIKLIPMDALNEVR